MMCHHGLGSLLRLAGDVVAENQRRRGETAPAPRAQGERTREELRLLYARGDLDRQTFLEMRDLAERGELTWADLEGARRQAEEMRAMESPEARDAGLALARLRQREKALERARLDSEAAARRLEEQAVDIVAQAGRDEDDARRVVLEDEARARSILEHRELMLEQAGRLRQTVRGLRQDVQRMDDLERQLRIHEQELEATLARARLGALEWEIRGQGAGQG